MKLRDLIKQELIEANNQPSEKDLVKAINSFFHGARLKFKVAGLSIITWEVFSRNFLAQ